MKEKLRAVGKSCLRKEAAEIATGGAKYAADIVLPNMLHAKILGSPYPHAMVRKIDVSQAEKIEGVVEILTHFNSPKKIFFPPNSKPQPLLNGRVLYVGEPVAVVAAETKDRAEEALAAIRVDYEKLPAVFDPIEAAKPGAPKLHPEGNIADPKGVPLVVEWGDVGKAIEQADVVLEKKVKTPMQSHSPLEPRSCTAYWDGGLLSVWAPTQVPHVVKYDLSRILELPVEKIRVLSRYLGGGFGGKKSEEYAIIAALLSMRTGRPVKLEYSREEETVIGRRRYSTIMKIKLAAKRDGTITAIDFETYYNVGARGDLMGGSLGFNVSFLYLYKYPNARFKAYDVNTNLNTAIPCRGVPLPSIQFCLEQLMDQLAERLNIDPVSIRVKNAYRTGEKMKPFGAILSKYLLKKCADKATEGSGFWRKWKGWSKPVRSEGPRRVGIGVAGSMGWSDYMNHHTSATVKVYPDATAELLIGSQDLGTGSNTTLTQIAAEELGIPFERFRVTAGDTQRTPEDHGAMASRTLKCVGVPVQRAARQAKAKLLEMAAQSLGPKAKVVDFRDGSFIKNDGRKIPLSQVVTKPVVESCQGIREREAAPQRNAIHRGGAVFQVAEVEVDVETGEIKVLNYTAAQDVGKAINPSIVEGQMQGGFLQGMGYALTEEILVNKEGKIMNSNFLDYKIVTARDAPDVKAIILESIEPDGPFGAFGAGEYGINPVAGAIANAVYNAVGIRADEIPMTSERMLKALKKL